MTATERELLLKIADILANQLADSDGLSTEESRAIRELSSWVRSEASDLEC